MTKKNAKNSNLNSNLLPPKRGVSRLEHKSGFFKEMPRKGKNVLTMWNQAEIKS